MTVNEAQRAQWNDENQVRTWPRRERITEAVTPTLLDAVAPKLGERLLDVGCGGGLAALDAAKGVGPGGSVTGFDLSAPLIGLAKQRASDAKATNVQFVAGDAQVDDIAGAPFDGVMSQFGVMFFADPVAAFTNIRRHLRGGARVVFACWQPGSENPWFPGPILARYAKPPATPPPPSTIPAPGPLAFGDPAYVRGVLSSAGFGDIEHRAFICDVVIPEDSIFDEEVLKPLRLDAERAAKAWADLQAFASTMRGNDGMLHIKLAPQIFTAVNAE